VRTYRWNLRQFEEFVRARRGRPACLGDLDAAMIQAWMDSMAAEDLAPSTMRVRQSTLSSLCAFLVKRSHLENNPVNRLDRPPHRREAPRQVPNSTLMDALVKAVLQRQHPRDVAIFLILRYSGMRRESVATLRVRNLDRGWGLRNVPVKGGKTRDIPLPAPVMQYLDRYVAEYLPTEVDDIKPDTPLFWSRYGHRRQGLVRRPMEGKNIWRLCKTYGRQIGYPMLKPHDLRHGVAMEVYEQHHDLEQVRGLLGHTRIETTQLYAQIRPAALKHAVKFYESKALDVLNS
jgi:integrase/recombinase XerC